MTEETKGPTKALQSFAVYQWPEFQAFARRLGIPLEKKTTGLTIKLVNDGLVEVTHCYRGEDRSRA